jgi:high-affinity iron transporter
MFSTAIVIFREILEIVLIVGAVLAATRGLAGRINWIVGGVAGGLAGSALVAIFAQTISNAASGIGQELFNAAILFTAAFVIGWTVLWMRKHARDMKAHLTKVGQDVTEGKLPLYSLSLIIGLAILREGAEIVLFIYGMLLSGQNVASIIAGSLSGIGLGLAVGIMLYLGLLSISAKYIFKVTSWLLILLVAGLTSQAVGYLSSAGYFADFSTPVWNSSWLLSDESVIGKALHSLIGYTAQPSMIQLLFYVTTLAGMLLIIAFMDRASEKKDMVLGSIQKAA